jgi:hypothetical protein
MNREFEHCIETIFINCNFAHLFCAEAGNNLFLCPTFTFFGDKTLGELLEVPYPQFAM